MTTRAVPALSPSHFEAFIASSSAPTTSTSGQDPADTISKSPASQILTLLPKSALLALRHVSQATKKWTETLESSVFETLDIVFPVPELLSTTATAMHRISKKCQRLTVKILGTSPDLSHFYDLPPRGELPAFPLLTHIRVIPPALEPFGSLLVFRRFLQAIAAPRLKHLAIDELTLSGILALRWGPFASYLESTWGDVKIWRGLTMIDIKLEPWWKTKPDPTCNISARTCLTCNIVIPETSAEKIERKRAKAEERAGIKILHDWLKSFEWNTMEKVKIEWVGTSGSRRNPLLLDEFAAKEGKGNWFSAPPIRWRHGCKEVWLGGVVVGPQDLEAMKDRLDGLEKVLVWRGWLGATLTGTIIKADGKEWVVVDIKDQKIITMKEKDWIEKTENGMHPKETSIVNTITKVLQTVLDESDDEPEDSNGVALQRISEHGSRFDRTQGQIKADGSGVSDPPNFMKTSKKVPLFIFQEE